MILHYNTSSVPFFAMVELKALGKRLMKKLSRCHSLP